MNESQARWRVRFYGKVQFVGFRYTARLLAGKLNGLPQDTIRERMRRLYV